VSVGYHIAINLTVAMWRNHDFKGII